MSMLRCILIYWPAPILIDKSKNNSVSERDWNIIKKRACMVINAESMGHIR